MSPGKCTGNECAYLFEIGRLQDLLTGFVFVSLLIAIATLAIVQFVKPAARGLIRWRATRAWRRRQERDRKLRYEDFASPPDWLRLWGLPSRLKLPEPKLESKPTSGPLGRGGAMTTSSTDHYMRQVQNEAVAVLEHPSEHFESFLLLTQGASVSDQATLIWVDVLRRFRPEAYAHAMEAQQSSGVADGKAEPRAAAKMVGTTITAAQEAVAAASERALDELQLELLGTWTLGGRYLALLAGLLVAIFAGQAVRAISPFTFLLGLSGGALASMIYESARGFAARRRR